MNCWHRAAVVLALLSLWSCGNKLQTREAVERGIRKGVTERGFNFDTMDVSIANVKFQGNQAEATVSFVPKGGRISDGVTMNYTLEPKNDEWVIVKRAAVGSSHSGGMSSPPPAIPPHGVDNQAGNPAPASPQSLPPNHPPLDGSKK